MAMPAVADHRSSFSFSFGYNNWAPAYPAPYVPAPVYTPYYVYPQPYVYSQPVYVAPTYTYGIGVYTYPMVYRPYYNHGFYGHYGYYGHRR